jgi:tyrosyl-tRNA synthetase
VTPGTEASGGAVRPLGGLLDELTWRGILHATTPGLPGRLATGRTIAGYNGFDPSGPSLHIGHLVPIMGLLRFQQHGGKPVALVGGGTGMIGDPSGTSGERNLLDRATLETNDAGIRSQLERFLVFTPSAGERGAVLVNNLDWLSGIGLIDWLRDVGKHFTIPYMLAKDSVQTRLDRGLSFTEFSYMLIQATDYEHLYRTMGVELQMGGADQWGNITAGLELIRRRAGLSGEAESAGEGGTVEDAPAHALAYRLLLSPSGTKFGKTAEGTSVWLDAKRTSPFAFYQHFLNTDDRDVGTYLRWFTLLDQPEVEALDAAVEARPEAREAQRALARDITTRAHGADAAAHAERVSTAAFSREPIRDPELLATLHQDVGGFSFTDADVAGGPTGIALASGLFASAGEARRAMQQGGLTINGERAAATDGSVPEPIAGEWLVVRFGKRRLAVGRRAPG